MSVSARALRSAGLDWVESIPEDWGTPSVGANFEVQLGKMLNPSAAAGDSLRPYLRNINVQWDRIDLDDLPLMHFDAGDRARYALRPGDLLVCEGGEVGRAAVWDGQLEDCYYQKALHRVRPYRDDSTRFLMYTLTAAASQGVFENEGNTSTIVHLTAEKLRGHRFPWPQPAEQRAITDFLDAESARIDAVVAARRRQVQLLNEARPAVLEAHLPRVETAALRIKRVAVMSAGGTPDTDKPSYWATDEGIPWVAIADMSGGGTVTATQKHVTVAGQGAARLRTGDTGVVLLAMYASVGATAFLGITASWNQAILGLTPRADLAEPRFLRYWLDHLAAYWPTVVKSNTQANLNAESVREAPFPDTAVVEQAAAADALDAQFEALNRREVLLKREVDLFLERRQALITAAVTGQLEIPGATA